MKKRLILLVILFQCLSVGAAGVIVKDPPRGDIHLISIGINKYSGTLYPLRLCVSDSEALVQKILIDNPRIADPELKDKNGNTITQYKIGNVYSHMLNDEEATIENIRTAFKEVITNSSTNDYFVFLFSGYSIESKEDETFIVPYSENMDIKYSFEGGLKLEGEDKSNLMPLIELAKLMEQIPSKNQLIISEAGNGTSFAHNLISELFESNALIAAGTERNRIILTTKEVGIEGGACADGSEINNGYMVKYILENGNLLDAFYDLNTYEFWLTRSEMMCPVSGKKYIASYQESDYRNILLKNYDKSGTRGSKSVKVNKPEEKKVDDVSRIYAFILATDTYNENQTSWDDLKNPINDADAIAAVLSSKYNAKIQKVYNKSKNEVLKEFLSFKQQIDENDKLLFFVAGHGYYSEDFSDGFLVMNDSNTLEDDLGMDSYLSMATLNRILDGVVSKQVFSIFDVCYGASFELNNADLLVENYARTKIDNGLDTFITEKDKNVSRIVLASGQYEVYDYWKNSQKHSPFAEKLIKAFEEEERFISPGKIFSYVQGNATTPILKQFGKHEARGDFLLKVNN